MTRRAYGACVPNSPDARTRTNVPPDVARPDRSSVAIGNSAAHTRVRRGATLHVSALLAIEKRSCLRNPSAGSQRFKTHIFDLGWGLGMVHSQIIPFCVLYCRFTM